jgi:ABC-type oligopeptide transport system substrate-binding subunit/DNA-binding SARP family transcriptional activator
VLRITTLGGVGIELDGVLLSEQLSRKASALVGYLIVKGGRHRREELAELLWPERSQSQSMSNLRVMLSSLRKHLGDSLIITRADVSINHETEIWVDILELEKGLAGQNPEAHLDLYQGDFLEGLSIRNSPDFEQLILNLRQEISQNLIRKFTASIDRMISQRDYPAGLGCAHTLLKLDPLNERAQQQIMALHFLMDQRQAALRQYEEYRLVLQDEWGVDPGPECEQLLEKIRSGHKSAVLEQFTPRATIKPPAFLTAAGESPEEYKKIFVGRENELAKLDQLLEKTLNGSGMMAFIKGEPGRGKTSLAEEFAQRAIQQHAELLVIWSACSAFQNIGDPFLVWRDTLRMLFGDVERLWLAGAIQHKHALRLWHSLPFTIQALLDNAPDLCQTLLRGIPLSSLYAAHAQANNDRIQQLLALEKRPALTDLHAQRVADHCTQLLQAISRQQPILIFLDDLHWADRPSISLLNQIVGRLGKARVLIVGTYRPEELLPSPRAERHPLRKVIHEARRRFGDILVDLDILTSQERRAFIDKYLDEEPNKFPDPFKKAFFDRTQGEALFVVELLRDMRERGIIYRDEDRDWQISEEPQWEKIPDKVLGVVQERIDRLPPNLKGMLRVASLIGNRFPAQLIARVLDQPETLTLQQLSQVLQHQHRLVSEQSIESLGDKLITNFEFAHFIYRQFLIEADGLGAGEELHLQKSIATQMEILYQGHTDLVAAKLAHHWLAAREEQRAGKYLDKAGDQARARYALDDAEIYYSKAIAIRQAVGLDSLAAKTYLKLGLAKLADYQWELAYQAYEKAFALFDQAADFEHPSTSLSTREFRLALAEPISLDPALMGSEISTYYGTQLFEGLITIDAEKNALPGAASHWEISDDGRRYIFYLREDLRWSDGSSLRAKDFEFALRRNLDPEWGCNDASPVPDADLLYPIKNAAAYCRGEVSVNQLGVRALDETTLQIDLERPTAYFLLLMTLSLAYPQPKELIEKFGEAWTQAGRLISNGPFELLSWEKGDGIQLGKNSHYRGNFPGNIDQIECRFYPDEEVAIREFQTGDIDALSLINASLKLRRFANIHPEGLYRVPDSNLWYALLRTDLQPLNDVNIRQALRLAIDRKQLVEVGFRDGRSPAYGGFIPPNVPGHAPALTPRDIDDAQNQARDRMEKAGYPCGSRFPEVTCVYPPGGQRVVDLLLTMWERCLGIQIKRRELPYQQLIEQVDNDPAAITLLGWSEHYPDPHCFLTQFCHGGDPQQPNRPRWHDPEFDELIRKAEKARYQGQRLELYRQADSILVAEQAVVIPISYGATGMMIASRVTISKTDTGTMRFKDLIIGNK